MTRHEHTPRGITLFVEGHTELVLPDFFHRWLDPQLSRPIGITAVKFQGVGNYLGDLAQKVALHLDGGKTDVIFGLIDLFGIPTEHIDLSREATVEDKVQLARTFIQKRIPAKHGARFRQHFAVHETEAWLLSDPELWPQKIRSQIQSRNPEQINFDKPPAKLLKELLGSYKKVTSAKNRFPKLDPRLAINKCPYLKLLADDLLRVSKSLQAPVTTA